MQRRRSLLGRVDELAQPPAVLDRHAVGTYRQLEPGFEYQLRRILITHDGLVFVEDDLLERKIRRVVAVEVVISRNTPSAARLSGSSSLTPPAARSGLASPLADSSTASRIFT